MTTRTARPTLATAAPRPRRMAGDEPLLTRVHLLARPQAGCVALQQLRAQGVSDAQVESLVARGALTRVARGTFIVGPPPMTHDQLRWAAVLTTANDQAVLSHTSAAELAEMLGPTHGTAWVTIPGQLRRRVVYTLVDVAETGYPGKIIIASTRRPTEPVFVGTTPITAPARTLVDIAATGGFGHARRAYREADYRGLLTVRALLCEVGRGIAGSRIVRRLLRSFPIVGEADTETPGEQLLLEAMLEVGLEPEVQVPVVAAGRRYRLDFFFRDRQASVEALGGVHRKRYRKREDDERTANLRTIGVTERRVENDDITADPLAQARAVAAWLETLPIINPIDS